MNIPSTSTVTKSVTEVVDSLPVDRIADIDVGGLGDAFSDTADLVTESAVVIGATGARLAWKNRSTVLTALILALATIGLVTVLKRRKAARQEREIA